MATQNYAGASWSDNAIFMNAQFDDVSLLVTGVDYQNLSDRPASVTFYGPSSFKQVYTVAAQTAETTRDVSGLNLHLVKTTFTNPKSGQQQNGYSLPAGWSMSFNWPA